VSIADALISGQRGAQMTARILTMTRAPERLAKDLMSLRLSPCTARLSAKFQSS
jgi:hypothetical protein